MSNLAIQQEILDELERLPAEQQRNVLRFARSLSTREVGVPGRDLLSFVGTFDPGELTMMSQAIEDGCSQVDPHEW